MSKIRTEPYFLSMGPQHPSTHGVLKILLKLDGEVILQATPEFGYIHRGLEKIAENRLYLQFVPLTDRLDYLSSMSCNFAYVMAVEKLANIAPPPRAEYLRVIMAELNRIASHLVWLGTFCLDLGAVSPFLYCFREREKIIDLFEMITGSRLTYNYMRFGGVVRDITPEFSKDALAFLNDFNSKIDEYEGLLTGNPIFQQRTKNIGILTPKQALAYGISGSILRASGVDHDLRRDHAYSIYNKFSFDVPLGNIGDSFDRYLVRVKEMRESTKILLQALNGIPEGPFRIKVPNNLMPAAGETYTAVESPRGEFGIFLVSCGANKPYRLKVRAPSFSNLGIVGNLLKGWKIADVVAILGSFDVVMGEIDR